MSNGIVLENINMSHGCFIEPKLLAEYGNQTRERILSTPLIVICSIPVAIIILLTVFGNLLVLFFKARVGRSNTTLLLWNLGLSDFLVGIIVLPLGAYHLTYRKWIFGRSLCRIWVAADVTFCTCSVVTICVISVDRYLAVTRPLHYKLLVTKTKVVVVLITIWTFSSGILLATIRWEQPSCYDDSKCFVGNEIRYLAHSVVFAFFLPASITLTLYWRIYKLARNRLKALDRGFLMIFNNSMNLFSNTISHQNTLRVHFGKNFDMMEHQRRILQTQERIAKTLGVVSFSFLFCWLPFFSLYLINYNCHGCVPSIAIDIASWLGYCNSMLNPIIYSFTIEEYKRSAQRLIIPTWKILHHCLPKFISSPPDLHAKRLPHHFHRTKKSARHKPSELDSKKIAIIANSVNQKRHQTEPPVLGQKKVSKDGAEVVIIEDNDDGQNEYVETNSYSFYNKASSHPSLSAKAALPRARNESRTESNGEDRFCFSTTSSCAITVFCDTCEVYI